MKVRIVADFHHRPFGLRKLAKNFNRCGICFHIGNGAVGIANQRYADSVGSGAAWVFKYANVQGVHDLTDGPFSYHLSENYPNPFSTMTHISYTLAKASNITLTVYTVLGQPIATLVNGKNEQGEHPVSWNGFNIPSGVYFYRLVAGDFAQTKKIVLMK